MGNCGYRINPDLIKRDEWLDAKSKLDWENEQKKIKLLLLGAGESGKSTIAKQMNLLYGKGISSKERKKYKLWIHNNIICGIQEIIKNLSLSTEPCLYPAEIALFENLNTHSTITNEIGNLINLVWNDPAIIDVWNQRSKYQVIDSVSDYVNDIIRISDEGYIPTLRDILLSRNKTSGITIKKFIIDGVKWELYDVGGQRNERRKWIHCFDNVTSVIYVAAINEYDQTLYGDRYQNRMVEAINLFGDVCSNEYFKDVSIILFLNKRDLYEEKIKRVDIRSVSEFQDYRGAKNNYEDGIEYFVNLFLSQNPNEDRIIYSHVMCAMDSGNIEVVFNACKSTILRKNLYANGYLT